MKKPKFFSAYFAPISIFAFSYSAAEIIFSSFIEAVMPSSLHYFSKCLQLPLGE